MASKNPLGRLTTLGPKQPWQVALLLPHNWDDMRSVTTDLSYGSLTARLGETLVIRGVLYGTPQVYHRPVPRTQAQIMGTKGEPLGFTIFGNTKQVVQALNAHAGNLCLHGRVGSFRDAPQLANAQIVHPAWAGRLRPRYPGKPKTIGADKVRDRIMAHLREALPEAEHYITEQVAGGDAHLLNHWIEQIAERHVTLRQLLITAHTPRNFTAGRKSHQVLEQLSAIAVARAAKSEREKRGASRWRLGNVDITCRSALLPFRLNTGQTSAVSEILSDLAADKPMHRLLAGDVGTGKTAVYGVAAATCVDAGARVAVLAPNTGLAKQIADNLTTWWPDLDTFSVTGSTKKKAELASHDLLVGTTALLHRDTGPLDFVIVDEQHKFSRDQREQLVGCHLLEATATCTPRAQALAELGIDAVSQLKTRPNNNRVVQTRLWTTDSRQALMAAIKTSIDNGDQVLVIYPERGEDNDNGDPDSVRRQAGQAYALWEKHFPGRVELTHGGLKADEKIAALDAMRSKQAQLLVSTTVVEVGIDLPGLMRVVVIHAERLGLVTLHQIRGRVARAGGTGHCDLFAEDAKVAEGTPAAERLQVLCETDDGFEVARRDMRLRGFGDLSSQSDAEKGFLDGVLYQRPVTPGHIETAITLLEATDAACHEQALAQA